jgi:hypothetical protein
MRFKHSPCQKIAAKKESIMIKKKILRPDRLRHIEEGFSFIPHRFLTEGFLDSLNPGELLLYFFLVLASDRHGLSFYAYDAICSLLGFSADDYIEARDGLIRKDLIAFDGTIFQVLDLPSNPVQALSTGFVSEPDREEKSSHIKNLVQLSLWKGQDGG